MPWKAVKRFDVKVPYNDGKLMTYAETDKIRELLTAAQAIVIMQADNPDADSLGSALALEQIFGEIGKEPYLYCGVQIPDYLHPAV